MAGATFGSLLDIALAREKTPDENRGNEIMIPEIALFAAATITVVARLFVRLRLKPRLWLDDWTMFAAYAWTIFGFITLALQVQNGLGRHVFWLDEESAIMAMKWNQIGRMTFIPSVALIKTSVCFFILRILDARTHPRFRTYIWLVMAASVISNIVLLVVWSVQCIPLDAAWDPRIEGTCLSPSVVVDVAYVQAGFNLVTDILCALFPIFFFTTSYMRWRTKGALILLVVLGILTSVTALLRVVYLHDLEDKDDPTWNLTNVTICALIEAKAGIILTCLPAIRCLWTEFLKLLSRGVGARKSSQAWDQMDSPILPSVDASKFLTRADSLDSMPLRTMSRQSSYVKAYEEPPLTPTAPGVDSAPIAKVTTWI